MKKVLLVLFAVTSAFLSVNAQEESRLVISAGQMKSITLGEDMKVVLISAESFQNEIKGDMNVFEKLNISVVDGAMRISAGRKLSGKETVFVVVSQLESLTLGQNTKVTTEGILRSSEIKVFVQEGSIARLKSTGAVNGYALDNIDISVTKTPIQFSTVGKM